MNRFARLVFFGQGIYYLLTGLWPIVSMVTFVAVTGPKVDLWLVRMVGLLVAVIGASLLTATAARRLTPEVLVLAAGGAASFAVIDLVYGLSGRISPVYLADAAVEVLLLVLIGIAWVSSRSNADSRP